MNGTRVSTVLMLAWLLIGASSAWADETTKTAAPPSASPQVGGADSAHPSDRVRRLARSVEAFLKEIGTGKTASDRPRRTAVIGVRAGKPVAKAQPDEMGDALGKLERDARKIHAAVESSPDPDFRSRGYRLLGDIYRALSESAYERAEVEKPAQSETPAAQPGGPAQ